jgi:hypothetical protein
MECNIKANSTMCSLSLQWKNMIFKNAILCDVTYIVTYSDFLQMYKNIVLKIVASTIVYKLCVLHF